MKTALMFTMMFAIIPMAPALAFDTQISSADYSAAEKAKSFLRFDLNTKKLGIFKSKVTGYVKKFTAKGKIEGQKLKDVLITFPVREMDTDLYARDDQMWNFCLGYKENPEVKITLAEHSFEEGKIASAMATINARGKSHPLPLEVKLEKVENRWVATGKAQVSLARLDIPDPSIGVASVNENIELSFFLEDSEK